MNSTTYYNLPLWEASDPISREDFNAAMSAIDAALKANANAASTAQSTANAARTAAAAIPMVKLLTKTTTADTTSVSLSLSSIDLTPYAAIKVYIEASLSSCEVRINGISSGYYSSDVYSGTTSHIVQFIGSGWNPSELTILLPVSGNNYTASLLTGAGSYHTINHGTLSLSSSLRTIDFVSDPYTLYANSRFTVYGVKK